MDGAGTPWPHCPAASCEPNNLTVSLATESPDLCDGGTGAVPTEATEHEMLSVKYPSRASQTFREGIRPPPSRRRCLGLTLTCSADLLPGAPRSPPPHTEAPSHPRSPAPPATRCRGPGAGWGEGGRSAISGSGPGAGHGGPQGRAGCLSSKPESPVSESRPDLGCWVKPPCLGAPPFQPENLQGPCGPPLRGCRPAGAGGDVTSGQMAAGPRAGEPRSGGLGVPCVVRILKIYPLSTCVPTWRRW